MGEPQQTDAAVIASVTGALVGARPKQPRRQPRCHGCNRVCKHVFCPACVARRQAISATATGKLRAHKPAAAKAA